MCLLENPIEHSVEGNGVALLLVSRSDEEGYVRVGPAMLSALNHLGIPYRIRDLDDGPLSVSELAGHACVILGQDRLGAKLGHAGAESLRDAVRKGVGLVCFDGRLDGYAAPFHELFAIQPGRTPLAESCFKTASVDHFITGTRELVDDVCSDSPVDVWPIDTDAAAFAGQVLLRTDAGQPMVIATNAGRGRAVLFTTSVGLWMKDAVGHAWGLDDVFWKSIVWAARKPFAIYPMPPFATALVDDCSGSYNHFRYLDTMNRHGWLPHVEIYLEDIDRVMHDETYRDSQKIKSLYDAGLAEFGVHGLTYDKLMWFDHANRTPLPDDVLRKNFEFYDECMAKWGIKPSRVENMHFGEIGRNALPFLKERGIECLSMALPFDTGWFDVPEKTPPFQPPGPYHLRGHYLGELPEDEYFFLTRSIFEPKDFSTTAVARRADYLWDNTIFWDESPRTNIERAAQTVVLQVRRGIDSRFFGLNVTHEQRVAVVRMDEWDEIWDRVDAGLRKYALIHRPWEYIFDYARSRHHTTLSAVQTGGDNGDIHCNLTGQTFLTTMLEIYTDDGDGVACRHCDVPSFTGSTCVTTSD